MKKTTQQFVEQAKRTHGDKYDYSNTVYQHSMEPLTIMCPKHGPFQVRPNNHLSSKQGCPKCSGKYQPTTAEFVERAKRVHGDTYDYSLVEYINNTTPVTIICSEHGEFKQIPTSHIGKQSKCPKCANVNKGAYHKSDTVKFIQKARAIHGDRYDYSKVEYKTTHTKVIIICPEHGEFLQTPASHISQGNGCNKCSYKNYQGGFNHKRFKNHPEIKNIPAQLYLIEMGGDRRFIKIGITQKTLRVRMNRARLPWTYTEIGTWEGTTYNLFLLEQRVKRKFKPNKYTQDIKFDGYTECFDVTAVNDIVDYVNGELCK